MFASTIAACVFSGAFVAAASTRRGVWRPEFDPQRTWAPCNRNAVAGGPSTFTPLSDAAAAALVTREAETRPYNDKAYRLDGTRYAAPNDYVPTALQLAAFRASKTSFGQTVTQLNPYLNYVDGRDGLRSPSTDDLIQWAAHKWGIPEDWLRAQYALESYWNSYMLGDPAPVPQSLYLEYPALQRMLGTGNVYESSGIAQVKWIPDGSSDPGTEPLSWESTAFSVDFQAATVRFYYDNPSGSRTAWGDAAYSPCQKWQSIGGWNSPYPWANAEQQTYIAKVQHLLDSAAWKTSTFLNWTPASFPPAISFIR
jgi:hypothetical protein